MALFGFGSDSKTPAAPQTQTGSIFDVNTADFEAKVIKASMEKPVLADFWAPWCGPCKQLTPILEAEVNAANGEVVLAKINIDNNPDLAQALQIQSVPTVMAFFQGQPVTGFAGARPQSEIKGLIDQLVKLARSAKPDAIDIPAVLKKAGELLAAKSYPNAQELYLQILQQDEGNGEAYAGIIRILLENELVQKAEEMLARAPEAVQKTQAYISAKVALDLKKNAGQAKTQLWPLQQKLQSDPANHQVRFELAQAQFGVGDKEGAIGSLLAIIMADKTWNDEAARKELLRFFEALGFNDPVAAEGRKKLSRILFS